MPETDLARIRRWALHTFPHHPGDGLRVALEVTDRHVTIIEQRPPMDDVTSPDWDSEPVARLTYVLSRQAWTLSIATWDGRFTRYRPLPTGPLEDLLAEIDEDPTFIIWG